MGCGESARLSAIGSLAAAGFARKYERRIGKEKWNQGLRRLNLGNAPTAVEWSFARPEKIG
jgi:hypothetical protein